MRGREMLFICADGYWHGSTIVTQVVLDFENLVVHAPPPQIVIASGNTVFFLLNCQVLLLVVDQVVERLSS